MNKRLKICLPAALIPFAAVGVLYGFSSSASAVDTTTGMTVASTSCSYALTVPASVTLTGANYTGASDTFSVVDTTMTLKSGGGGVPATPCSWTSGTGASLGMTLVGTGFAGTPTNYNTLLSTAPLIVAPVSTGCTANEGKSLSWAASTDVPTDSGAFATLLHVSTTQTCTFSTSYSFTIPAAKTVYGSSITLTGPVLTTTNTVT